uniref:Dynein regulatory complex protein 1/2 N-terminal domain-containing protein n=1 Tax=Glossina palpalis gambiensis TaxID=67801 RepID=A0A1B0BRR8_9MUSC
MDAPAIDFTLPPDILRLTIGEPMYITDEELAPPPPPPPPPPKRKRPTKAEKMERRRREEIKFKQLEKREELKRELAMSKKSAKKAQQGWEDMCKGIKIKELRSELEEWEIKTGRILKQKDDKIALLIDDIIVTEEMHKHAMRAFHETAKLLYEAQASDMMHEFYDEIRDRDKVTNDIKVKCENVMHANNLVVEHQMLSDYHIFLDKRDDRVNTEIEKRYRLRESIITKMRFLQKQLTTFLESLRSASLDVHKYERVSQLMERQKNFVVESQKLNDVEARSSRIHIDLQRDILHVGAEAQRKIKDLRLEHAYFVQMRKNIENEMKQDRQETYEKLKILTFRCFQTNKKYKKLKKYGELLLSLAANCRKLQTESEKVVPWGDFEEAIDVTADQIEFKLNVLDLKSHVDLDEKELDAQIQLMSTFWRRQALAEAQIALLNEKKMKLEADNQKHINKIKRINNVADVAELTKTLTVDCIWPEHKAPPARCTQYTFVRPL